ncbi:hypothetical protein FNV43_RR03445 [Rhamnella rubrinervis]|uniref:Uncharacterized protein n=1 Tax=Rhamnella rubrinervis TaxID=2594499 RepID=A0A8K0HI06_9ROSA|nr:hypothetical protein FNV43_RR03445 [Rhamnella rubrinervis]
MASGAASAADGVFRCVFDGCIAGCDAIERRPYHRNCSCALHKSRQQCGHAWHKTKNISYPMRRAWSEGCLSLHLVASANSSPSSSPHAAVAKTNTTHHLGLFEEEEDDQDQDHSSIFINV